jgi:hypothetical protein
MVGRNWKRANLPGASERMLVVLRCLEQSKEQEFPFVFLEGVGKKTIRALIERDWIFESPGLDGVRYKITLNGSKALAAYSTSPYRSDGICPRCGLRPRHMAANGTLQPYCIECKRQQGNRAYALKGNRLKPDGLCASCKEKPRHVYPSGYVIPYCKECRREMRKAEKRRRQARLLARIRAGEFVPCLRCKKACRHIAGSTVYDYCYDCYRHQQNSCAKKRALKRVHLGTKVEQQAVGK